MPSLSISTVLARLQRGPIVPPAAPAFHKGWGEREDEREWVKGFNALYVRYSNRRDYVGLEIRTQHPQTHTITNTVSVLDREGVRTLVFVKSKRGHGHIIRRIKLTDREKVGGYTAVINNFLKGEPLCAKLKHLQSAFLPAV